MILIDLHPVVIGNLMVHMKGIEISEDLVRHQVLTSLLNYKRRFGAEYGQLVIAADDKMNWRKEKFSFYKAGRRKDREASNINWSMIFDILGNIKRELKEFFPYKFIQVPRAEADDIIGVLCKTKSMLEKTIIVSSDKDMKQLLRYNNVKFYSIYHKTMMDVENPERYLKEHILSGDSSDGVPNFLSDDDTFMNPSKRQTPLRQAKLAEYMGLPVAAFDPSLIRNFDRNRLMIDMECIPEDVQQAIINEYENVPVADGRGLFKYFMEKKLKNLMSDLSGFTS